MIQEYYWEPWRFCNGYKEFENKKYYKDTGCINCPYKNNPKIDIKEIRKPLKLQNNKEYIIPYNSIINVCTESDFFLADADKWRNRAWDCIRERKDSLFVIETKFIHRIKDCIPSDFNTMNNIMIYLSLSCKQELYKIQQLLEIDVKYKGISIQPLIMRINIEKYLSTQQILDVKVNGEYKTNNTREMDEYDLYKLYEQCKKHGINMHIEYYSRKTKLYTQNNKKDKIVINDKLILDKANDESIKSITKSYSEKFNIESSYNLKDILYKLRIIDTQRTLKSLNEKILKNF